MTIEPPAPPSRFPASVSVLCLLLLLLGGAPLSAATVELANGDRISGEMVSLRDGTLTFRTDWGGQLTIDWSAVVSVTSESALTVVLDDGSRLVGPVEDPAEGGEALTVRPETAAAPVEVDLARVVGINPPRRAVRVRGNASAGVVVHEGNTETRSLYLEGQVTARTEVNRYTLGAQATRAEDEGEATADSSRGWIEYDHFVSERWYLASSVLFTQDEFQDLQLRSALSLSSGFQVFETERTDLSLELGASYVDENFVETGDDAYPAGRWAVDGRHGLAGGQVELFHFQEGLVDLEEGGEILLRSKTGARFLLFKGFIATTQVNFDYDEEPAPGRDEEDWVYLLNLGVEW